MKQVLNSKEEIAAAFAVVNGVVQQQQLKILRRMLNRWSLISTTRSIISNWTFNRRSRHSSVIGIKMARQLLPRSTASRRSVFDGMKNAWKQEKRANFKTLKQERTQDLLEAGANFTTITPQDDKINGLKSLQQILKRWSIVSLVRILHQLKLNMVQAQHQFQQKIKALRGMGHLSIRQMTEMMRSKQANAFVTFRRNWTDSFTGLTESLAVDALGEQLSAKQRLCDQLQHENLAFSQTVEGLESEICGLKVNLQTLHAHLMCSNWHSCFVCLFYKVKPISYGPFRSTHSLWLELVLGLVSGRAAYTLVTRTINHVCDPLR